MTDNTNTNPATPPQTISQVIAQKPDVPLIVRIIGGAASAFASSFLLTWCSLHGVDFKTLGIDSELVKSGITGLLTTIAVAPESVPIAIAGFILYCRKSGRIVIGAFTKKLPPEESSP